MTRPQITGACLCGAVRFRGRPDGEATRCHCEQCRRWAGDAWPSVRLLDAEVTGGALRWYRSSDAAERGFCAECGASLFWREIGADYISVSLGCIDPPTGIALNRHIFTAYKGDYDQITDDLPQDAEE